MPPTGRKWSDRAFCCWDYRWGVANSCRVVYSIISLILVGLALTLGPVVYKTVERIQAVLVTVVLLFLVVIFFLVVEFAHVVDMLKGIANVGYIPDGMELPLLLGAIAFAGAGGTMNLAQSDFVRDKGYAMGHYVGRLTSPLTGRSEVVSDIGFHFRQDADNLSGSWTSSGPAPSSAILRLLRCRISCPDFGSSHPPLRFRNRFLAQRARFNQGRR